MPQDLYPKQCYFLMKTLDLTGRHTWVSTSYGFGVVWYDMGNVKHFISTFKQGLVDCNKQHMFGEIMYSPHFVHYKLIKSTLEVEYCVANIHVKVVRRYICLLSLHALPLQFNKKKAKILYD